MADGTIRIGLELEDGGVKSEAKAAGTAAGDAAGSGLEQGLDQGSKSGADKAGANIESFGDKMKGVLAGISVAALAASIGELVSTTNEFQEDMGKLSVAAQQNSVSAGEANKAYRDMVGILGETDQSVEAVNHLFALCGDNTQALSDWTNIASGVYATFGDSLPLEGLTEAANETARVGQVTGPFADAINWATASAEELGDTLDGNVDAQDAFYAAIDGGATVEDAYTAALQACSDEGERAQVITDTLTGLYGEAGEQYQQTNEDVINYRQSQSDLTQAMSDLGQAFMPVVTGVTNMAAALVSGLQPAADWFVQNLPIIAPILAGIATAVGILTVASMAQSAATTIAATAQGLLNAALSANPIVLVVALIAGLIAAIVLLWNNSEAFRSFVTGAFENIMSVAQTVIYAIVGFFTGTVPNAIGVVVGFFQNLWDTIVSVFNGALSTVSGFVSSVVRFFTSDVPNGIMNMLGVAGQIPGQIASFLGNALSSAWNFVGNFAGAAIDAASQFVSNIMNGLSGLGWQVVSVGSNIVNGIWEGISGASGWLMSQISDFASNVVDGIKGFFGISSPSKVMRDEVGRYLAEGVAVGWEQNDPLSSIERDMKVGVSKLSVQAQAVDGIGATTNNQTINFNQPVESPDQIARTMRLQQRYGLAGSYV
jgi:phage-related protein|nr:MAG TPA: minor tail protein [Caudoviricetes sp.]